MQGVFVWCQGIYVEPGIILERTKKFLAIFSRLNSLDSSLKTDRKSIIGLEENNPVAH